MVATAFGVVYFVALVVIFYRTAADQKVAVVSLFALLGVVCGAWVNSTFNLFATFARESAGRDALGYYRQYYISTLASLPQDLVHKLTSENDTDTRIVKWSLKHFE